VGLEETWETGAAQLLMAKMRTIRVDLVEFIVVSIEAAGVFLKVAWTLNGLGIG
jgi:hypothetical protein